MNTLLDTIEKNIGLSNTTDTAKGKLDGLQA